MNFFLSTEQLEKLAEQGLISRETCTVSFTWSNEDPLKEAIERIMEETPAE